MTYPLFVTITQRTDIKASTICDLLSTAFEGGSNYWIEEVTVPDFHGKHYADQVVGYADGPINIVVDDGDGRIYHKLTCNDMLAGIKLFCESNDILPASLEEDFDADVADQILQYALFQEVIYG